METFVIVLIGLILTWIGIQDFRERQISLLALVILFGLCILNYCFALHFRELPLRVMINSLFAGIILVSGTLLVKIRRPGDSISTFIGAGDFLFLMVISPMFSFGSYLVFLNTSIVLILLVYGVLLVLKQIRSDSPIPMAGAMAICLIAFAAINQFTGPDMFEEITWIYSIKR